MALINDAVSIAPSEAMTVVNHDIIESSDFGRNKAVTIEIKLSELLSPEELAHYNTRRHAGRRHSRIDRFINQIKTKAPAEPLADDTKKIKMSREDYLAYWAKDKEGQYIGSNPPEKGREIWRSKLWAELYLPPPNGSNIANRTGPNAKPGDFPTAFGEATW